MRPLSFARVVVVALLGLALPASSGCTRPNPELLTTELPDLSAIPVAADGSIDDRDDLASPADQSTPWSDYDFSLPVDLTNPVTLVDLASHDAKAAPLDLSTVPDLALPRGVNCGNLTCAGAAPSCCYDPNPACVPAHQMCNSGPFACDGPEDCTPGQECCFDNTQVYSTCSALPVCNGAPLCHATADCPAFGGFVACCPVAGFAAYKSCSRTACN